MIVIGREFLSYDKDNIKYHINFPKLYNDKDFIKDEMSELINKIIFEDIAIFLEIVEDSYSNIVENNMLINTLTEFDIGFQFKDIISIAIEYTQLSGILDISYLKGYNYDFNLKKEIKLKDLFKEEVSFEEILKEYISEQIIKIIGEINNLKGYNYDFNLKKEIKLKDLFKEEVSFEEILKEYISEQIIKIIGEINTQEEYGLDESIVNNIYIDENSIFYFNSEYLILSFSSCELSQNIMNLVEFKIPFNRIYSYLNEYAIKNIVKKMIF